MIANIGNRWKERVKSISLTLLLVAIWCGTAVAAGEAPVTYLGDLDDPVAVRSWLVAGPLPSPDLPRQGPNSWPKRVGYEKDYLADQGGEAEYRAVEGTRVTSDDGVVVSFHDYVWNTAYIDLTEIYGRPARVAAYLYAEIESDEARRVYLHIGANDAAKVWVNGDLLLAYPMDRRASRSQFVVVASIPEGRSRILMKIDQAGENWGAYCEIADSPNLHIAPRDRYPTVVNSWDDRQWFSGESMSKMGFLAFVLFLIVGVPVGAIFLIAWLIYRYSTERNRRETEARLAMAGHGTDPLSTPPPSPLPVRRKSSNGLLVWGVVLSLAGLGLTIGELAHAGLGNAGMEMAIMFVGIGLLAIFKYRGSDGRDGYDNNGGAPPPDSDIV